MSERVAIITGGAKRVGRAIVEKFAGEGFRVCFTYNSSKEDAEQLARQIDGHAVQADLLDPIAAVEKIAAEFSSRFSRLDVLVNNASLYTPADLAHTNVELSRKLMAVHVESPTLLCQKFAALLRQSNGHVVNMLDVMAEKPMPGYLAYCTSKAALANLTLGLARELAPEVTVNGIAPGVVEWPNDMPQTERDKYLQRVPLKRAGTPQDVANVIHFLCTTGNYITGQIIRLDGGRSIV